MNDKTEMTSNNSSLDNIFESCKKRLFFSALVMLGNSHDAEDALQEVYLLAFKSVKNNHSIEITKAWFGKIMVNHCRKVLSKSKRFKLVDIASVKETEKLGIVSNFNSLDVQEIEMLDILCKLKHDEKTLLVLKYVYDLKIFDISKIVNVKEGTVKSQISRSLAKVRERLNKEGDLK